MTVFEKLGCKYPILQGAMANISHYQLVAAVSEAGGIGVLQAGSSNAEELREEVRKVKALTDKPFGVNVLMVSPFRDGIAKMVCEEKVAVVTTGAGNPGPYMNMWKEAGVTIIPVVPTVALAKRMVKAGADALICEGTEAGGHIGELTTMTLIPQVVDAVDVEVIAAGGIADNRGVIAALALGASGIQAGTVFLASDECPIHENYKNSVVSAKDTSTIVTGRHTGAPVRVIKNHMAKEYMKIAKTGIELEKLEELTLGSLRKAVVEGDMKMGSIMAGQIAGLIKEIKPVKTIIEEMFTGSEIIKTLGENKWVK